MALDTFGASLDLANYNIYWLAFFALKNAPKVWHILLHLRNMTSHEAKYELAAKSV